MNWWQYHVCLPTLKFGIKVRKGNWLFFWGGCYLMTTIDKIIKLIKTKWTFFFSRKETNHRYSLKLRSLKWHFNLAEFGEYTVGRILKKSVSQMILVFLWWLEYFRSQKYLLGMPYVYDLRWHFHKAGDAGDTLSTWVWTSETYGTDSWIVYSQHESLCY